MISSFHTAVVPSSPVFFDKDKTKEKIKRLTGGAASNNAQLTLFPEAADCRDSGQDTLTPPAREWRQKK